MNKKPENILREIVKEEFDNENLMELHKETVSHLCRCFNIAKDFGNFLKVSKDEVEILSECALLHDLGKFHIDVDILYKTTFLTDKEFTIIKNHVNYKPKSDLSDEVLNCIKYHHERPAKNGYLKNNYNQISPLAKIISIIDVFDVISNKRCYKSVTLNLTNAIDEIKKNIGGQFDEHYGNLFIRFLESKI